MFDFTKFIDQAVTSIPSEPNLVIIAVAYTILSIIITDYIARERIIFNNNAQVYVFFLGVFMLLPLLLPYLALDLAIGKLFTYAHIPGGEDNVSETKDTLKSNVYDRYKK